MMSGSVVLLTNVGRHWPTPVNDRMIERRNNTSLWSQLYVSLHHVHCYVGHLEHFVVLGPTLGVIYTAKVKMMRMTFNCLYATFLTYDSPCPPSFSLLEGTNSISQWVFFQCATLPGSGEISQLPTVLFNIVALHCNILHNIGQGSCHSTVE